MLMGTVVLSDSLLDAASVRVVISPNCLPSLRSRCSQFVYRFTYHVTKISPLVLSLNRTGQDKAYKGEGNLPTEGECGLKDKAKAEVKIYTEDEVMHIVKDFIGEQEQSYVPLGRLEQAVKVKFPKTTKTDLEQRIGVLKNKGKLGEKRVKGARLLFPLAMIKLYMESQEE